MSVSARSELGVLLLSFSSTVTGVPLTKSLSLAVKCFEEEEAHSQGQKEKNTGLSGKTANRQRVCCLEPTKELECSLLEQGRHN